MAVYSMGACNVGDWHNAWENYREYEMNKLRRKSNNNEGKMKETKEERGKGGPSWINKETGRKKYNETVRRSWQ
jgi:hypothetical protein